MVYFQRASVGVLAVSLWIALPALAQHRSRRRGDADPSTTASATGESMRESTAHEADMRDERARSHFRLGSEMYNLGRYPEAAAEFQSAYDLSARPELLYNVYLAQRDAQHPREAGDALRRYLAEVAAIPNRAQLESRLASYDEAARLRVAEEEARAAAAAESERQRMEAEAAAAAAHERAERAEAARLAAVSTVHTRPWWPWLLTGIGVATVGGGVYVGIDAGGQADALRTKCQGSVGGRLLCNNGIGAAAAGSNISSQALLGDALWIGGIAVGVTGTILAFALDDDVSSAPAPPSQATVVPQLSCGTSGCSAGIQGSF